MRLVWLLLAVHQGNQRVAPLHPPSQVPPCPLWPAGATAAAGGRTQQRQGEGSVALAVAVAAGVAELSACLSPSDVFAGGVGATPACACR